MNPKREKVKAQLESARAAVQEAIGRVRAGSPGVASVETLEFMASELDKMLDGLLRDELPPRGSRTPGLWHIVTDGWPIKDPLGEKIVAAEWAYERL